MTYPVAPPSPAARRPLRRPVVVSHLGPGVAARLADHPGRPQLVDAPDLDRPWRVPPGADVLLPRPGAAWPPPDTVRALDARALAGARAGLHVVSAASSARRAAASSTRTRRWPRVRITPHMSWQGGDREGRLARRVADDLSAYAAGLTPSDVVDPVSRY